MSTQDELRTSQQPQIEPEPRFGSLTPWLITVGLLLLSVLSWWILADPKWSPVGASQPAVDAVLFWTILGFIFTGFTFANWPFSKVRQPLAGLLQVAADVAIGFLAAWLFSFVIGSWDPTFSHSAPGGVGFTATAFVVLIGFYSYALAAASWGGYPFEEVPAPLANVAQFFLGAFITLVGVVVLIYPNFNATLAKNAPVALAPATGWVYSSIVIVIVAAMLWQNWPWAPVVSRHWRAAAALAVTLGGGVGLYYLLRLVVLAITPASVKALPTFAAGLQAAQLGVCFSLWALVVGLLFGPSRRFKLGTAAVRVSRTVVVTALAIVAYVIFMGFFATKVLHFPPLSGSYGGSPLTWIDWTILIVLWYTVAFEKYGSTKAAAAPAQAAGVTGAAGSAAAGTSA
jgi:AAT family amino acid transporter